MGKNIDIAKERLCYFGVSEDGLTEILKHEKIKGDIKKFANGSFEDNLTIIKEVFPSIYTNTLNQKNVIKPILKVDKSAKISFKAPDTFKKNLLIKGATCLKRVQSVESDINLYKKNMGL